MNTTEDVTLNLNGINLTSKTDSPISVVQAGVFILHLANKCKNYISDTEANTLDGVINVKKTNLNIVGEGYLYVTSLGIVSDTIESGKGIYTSKNLVINNTHIKVLLFDDHAIDGKTEVSITDSKVIAVSKADGVHSKAGSVEIADSIISLGTYGDGTDSAVSTTVTGST